MSKYIIWDNESDVYTPSGEKFTANEWRERHKWASIPGAKMIITSGNINGGCAMEYDSAVSFYKKRGAEITDGMTDEEALAAIEEFEENPPGANDPSTEERTAAALEYIALNSLPDE